MPRLTPVRAAVIAALVAAVIYAQAVGHEWALDDEPIIRENPTAQSAGAAASAFFSPYWPVEAGIYAGQYRPLTMLTFGVDWSLSGGEPAWLHLVNILLHAAVTALLVMVAMAWLPPAGALSAGVVFAIHPVHVEAVASVVGRAELLAALGLLAMLLCARRYRRAVTGPRRAAWLALALAALVVALLSKEHAVVGVALLALDEFLDQRGDLARSADLYVGVVAVTLGWFYLWHAVAGGFVDYSEAATIRGLGALQRLATVLPAQLEVVRLLAWPMDLVSDYNPLTIPQRLEWSPAALAASVIAAAILLLAVVLRRRAPALTFGIVAGVVTYLPTSNILFASGVMLGERNLYLAAMAPSLAVGAVVARGAAGRQHRLALLAVGALLAAYAVRTVTRVPVWKNTGTVVVEDFARHSENYRTRLRVGSAFQGRGDLPAAFAEAMAAAAIFPQDPFVARFTVPRARRLGYDTVALAEARRALNQIPDHPILARLVVAAHLRMGSLDSALALSRSAMSRAPESGVSVDGYLTVLDSMRAAPWQKHLARARKAMLQARFGMASAEVDSALSGLPAQIGQPSQCWDLAEGLPLVRRVGGRRAATAEAAWAASAPVCGG